MVNKLIVNKTYVRKNIQHANPQVVTNFLLV